jgi:hypothetical protein
VRFFSEFCSSENCADVYKRILDVVPVPCYGRSIVFTTGEDYTHAVILNKATPDLTCPKENVLGLAFEPRPFLRLTDSFLGYARENIGAYYIGDADGLGWPFVGHHGFMWHPATIKEKTRIMWMVFSEKTESFGHRYRHEIVRRILGDGLPIDVYERGCPLYGDHERLRGVFTDAEPYDGYAFSIVVENFSSPHYFSEKIMNPLLFETVPLYYGATRIEDYFPGQSIRLTGEIGDDLRTIRSVLADPQKYTDLRKDRYDTVRKLSLLEHLDKIFSLKK